MPFAQLWATTSTQCCRSARALILHALNFVISLTLISVLFGAIYKVLPDAELSWRDALVGAVVTALLFNLGKFLIGLYLSPQHDGFQLRRGRVH